MGVETVIAGAALLSSVAGTAMAMKSQDEPKSAAKS